jgi:hypothetical protein
MVKRLICWGLFTISIAWVGSSSAPSDTAGQMAQRIVEWNPHDRSRLVSASSGDSAKLQLLQLKLRNSDGSPNKPKDIGDGPSSVTVEKELVAHGLSLSDAECTCLNWHSSEAYNAYVAFGSSAGTVSLWNHADNQEVRNYFLNSICVGRRSIIYDLY